MTTERVRRAQGVHLLFGSLLVFWLLLNETLAWDVVVVGVVAAVVITVAVASDLSFLSEFRATARAGPHP